MLSDNYYDGFNYNSSQDNSEIEYQIDLFENRQYSKCKKHNKQKIHIPSYPISMKTFRSQHLLARILCMNNRKILEGKQKQFARYLPQAKIFECDKELQEETIDVQSNLSSKTKKSSDFFNFRRRFYDVNHHKIKSCLNGRSSIEIVDIRFASINQSVRNDFMNKLNENTSYDPHLVYHGTNLNNIKSILHYGFLIPNQVHPTNSKAPIITTKNGSAYGEGVYCSQSAKYSLSYVRATNTLLVCAAIPKRDKAGVVERSYGNILVLSHVSEIIPLFLIDFMYLYGYGVNYSWYDKTSRLMGTKKEKLSKLLIMPRKYLRKLLNYMNDQVRTKNKYQLRIFQ